MIVELLEQMLIAAMRVAAHWPMPSRREARLALLWLPNDRFGEVVSWG